MGSRYDGVCLRRPGIGRSHGPVRPSCLGRARGNRVAEARGELRRDGRSDGRGQSGRQRGDGRKLVRRWLGAVPSCIGRPAWLRVPKGFLRAARGPRRRARGGACAASCRAGALVARADRGRDRGRTAGTDGLCVRYLQGDQRVAA